MNTAANTAASTTYRMADVLPLVDSIAEQMGVPKEFVRGIFISENSSDGRLAPDKQLALNTQGIDPETGKPSGALGLFQIVGTTFQNLKKQGKIPADLNYGTLEGQVTAGVAAAKDVLQATGGDQQAAAALYVNGQAGLAGYRGAAPMPAQTAHYLRKFATATGTPMDATSSSSSSSAPAPGTSTSVSISSKRIPAEVKSTLDADLAAYSAAGDRTLPMLQAMGVQMDAVAASAKEAIQAEASASTDVIGTAAKREAEKVRQQQQLAGIFYSNPEQLVTQMTAVAAEEAKAQENKVVMDELMAINPVANPVKWLVAQMQLGAIVPQYNSAVQNVNRLNDQIATKQQMAVHQQSITPAVQLATIEEERRAKVQVEAAKAKLNLAKVDMESISGRSRLMNEELTILGQQANMSLSSARLQAEALGLRADQAATKAQQGMLDRIDLLRTRLNAPPIGSMQLFNRLPKDQQDFLVNASTEGTTPAKTIRNVLAWGSLTAMQRDPDNSAMGDQIVEIGNAVKPDVDALVAKGMKYNDALEKAINDKDKFWRDEIADGDMTKASTNNPYKMNATQYAMAPTLKGNSFAEYINGSGKAIPNLGEKEILAYAVGQVKAGTKTIDQVTAELYNFFTQGFEHQWKTRGMGTIGFDPRTYRAPGTTQPATSYAVSSNIFGWYDRTFGSNPAPDKPIKLMNETSIKHFLTMASVRDIQLNNARMSAIDAASQDIGNPRRAVTATGQPTVKTPFSGAN